MLNKIDLDFQSKDLPKTALAFQTASSLKHILNFITFWGIVVVLLGGVSLFLRAKPKVSVYNRLYSVEYSKCLLDLSDNIRRYELCPSLVKVELARQNILPD